MIVGGDLEPGTLRCGGRVIGLRQRHVAAVAAPPLEQLYRAIEVASSDHFLAQAQHFPSIADLGTSVDAATAAQRRAKSSAGSRKARHRTRVGADKGVDERGLICSQMNRDG